MIRTKDKHLDNQNTNAPYMKRYNAPVLNPVSAPLVIPVFFASTKLTVYLFEFKIQVVYNVLF